MWPGISLATDALVNLFPVNGDLFWRLHANANLVTLYTQYSHVDIVPDDHGLPYSSRQNQHYSSPSSVFFLFSRPVFLIVTIARHKKRRFPTVEGSGNSGLMLQLRSHRAVISEAQPFFIISSSS
jgi:hypothetical protein